MVKRRIFFTAFLFAFAATASGFAALVAFCGLGIGGESFVPKLRAFKLEVARRAESPRLFVLSGSNSCYALDSEALSAATGYHVVNLSVIISEAARFYLADLKELLREGDVVYLPFEFEHYSRTHEESLYSPFNVSWAFGTDPRVRSWYTPIERVRLYAKYGLGWLCKSVRLQMAGEVEEVTGEGVWTAFERGGDPLLDRLNRYGDLSLEIETSMNPEAKNAIPTTFSDEFRNVLSEIVALAEERKAKVILGYPPLYSYPRDIEFPAFQKELESLGLPVIGRPEAFAWPYGYYSNSRYHLLKAGAKLHTRELIKGFAKLLGTSGPTDIPRQVVFADEPHALRRIGGVSAVEISVPDDLRGGAVYAEFMIDGGRGEIVKSVRVQGEPVRFVEIPEPAKTLLRVIAEPKGASVLRFEIALPETNRIERVLLDSDSKRSRGAW